MRHTLIIATLTLSCLSELPAQTSLHDYRQEVITYSHELKLSELATEAADADMRRATKGHLPSLGLASDIALDFSDTSPSRPWSWLVNVALKQTIYQGGGVRATVKRRSALHAKSEMDEQIALLDAIYSADIAYWQLSRSKSYLETISEYVAVVDSLRGIVKRRFDEGYSAKGDLLQIESRISDARYQLSSATQSYLIALHNYNSLRGAEIDSCVELMESIFSIRDIPSRISAAEVVEHHPRYQSMLFGVEGARWGIKTSQAEFLPSLHLSIYGSAEPQTPHIKGGGSRVNGGAVLSLSVPIFHFGERREATRAAEAKYLQELTLTESVKDDITLIEGDAWQNIYNSRQRVDVARQSLDIAQENLEMSIYSYGEGVATILDVLQAQLSWLQISQNAIAAYYDYAIAIASYEYVTGATLKEITE